MTVRAPPPTTADGTPISAYVIRSPTPVGEEATVVPAQDGLSYTLFGNGKKGSLSFGKPSVERARVLRREALELALYTLEYAGEVGSVLVFMPPAPNKDPELALLFRRAILGRELDRPLAATLAQRSFSTTTGGASALEGQVVDQITAPWLYRYGYQQDPSGAQLLVLIPAT